jgi:uncharacterized protein with HEPN domain
MSETRRWLLYINDMLGFAAKVQAYTNGLTQASFVANELVYDATLRNLELIGEAASKVPDDVRSAWPSVPWRQMTATRNRLIHGYLGIDDDTVWSIIETDIPALIKQLEHLKNSQQDGPS